MSKVYAVLSGFVGFGGQSVALNAGDEYDASDPLVQAHPQHFTAVAPASAVVAAEKSKRAKRT